MSTARKIAKNTTVLFISQIITYVLGFFITVYTIRVYVRTLPSFVAGLSFY